MSVRMTVMVEYVGITSAMLAKERLKAIIKQDREVAPSFRWLERWNYRMLWARALWHLSPEQRLKLSKRILRWERRR